MTSSDSDIDDLPQDDTLAEESLAETASDADSTDEDSTDEQDQKLTLDVTIDEPSACERHITVTVARPDMKDTWMTPSVSSYPKPKFPVSELVERRGSWLKPASRGKLETRSRDLS